jgi:serine/threonine protein kinase
VINNIERCGIYHRDLKFSNIVINYELPIVEHMEGVRVQLIDFGMAGIANFEMYRTKTNCGS